MKTRKAWNFISNVFRGKARTISYKCLGGVVIQYIDFLIAGCYPGGVKLLNFLWFNYFNCSKCLILPTTVPDSVVIFHSFLFFFQMRGVFIIIKKASRLFLLQSSKVASYRSELLILFKFGKE